MKYKVMLFGVAAAFVMAGCHRGGGGGDNIAMVGTDPITKQDYYAHLATKVRFMGAAVKGSTSVVDVVPSPGYQALQDMIVNALWLQIAKDQGVLPTPDEVNKELVFRMDINPQLLDQGMKVGLSKQEILDELKIDMCKLKIQTKGVAVTPDEVDSYIKEHPQAFQTSAKVDSQVIVVKTKADCDKADAALKSGQPFATVAQTFSFDPDGKQKQNNYRFPITDESQMPATIKTLLEATPELKDTPWQTLGQGNQLAYAKFFVLRKEKAAPLKITDTIKEQVRRGLLTQKGQKKGINVDKLLIDRIQAEKAKIQVFDKVDAAYWANFTAQIDKAVAQLNAQGSTLGAVGSSPPSTGGTPAPAAK